jgi:hypothetical protein
LSGFVEWGGRGPQLDIVERDGRQGDGVPARAGPVGLGLLGHHRGLLKITGGQ